MTRLAAPGRLALAAVALLGLTGCVRVDVDTTISADGTFSQHSIVAADPDAIERLADQLGGMGGELGPAGDLGDLPLDLDELDEAAEDQVLGDLAERYPDQVQVDQYTDEELEGVEVTLTDLPIDELGLAGDAAGTLGATATLETLDDAYVVTLAPPAELDLGAAGLTSANLELIDAQADVEVTYTFPGLVRSASAGEVEGRSVTLGLADLLSGREIVIEAGRDREVDWAPVLRWGGFGLAFALVIGGAIALIIQDRRSRTRSTLPPPVTSQEPTGPGLIARDARDDEPPPHRPS